MYIYKYVCILYICIYTHSFYVERFERRIAAPPRDAWKSPSWGRTFAKPWDPLQETIEEWKVGGYNRFQNSGESSSIIPKPCFHMILCVHVILRVYITHTYIYICISIYPHTHTIIYRYIQAEKIDSASNHPSLHWGLPKHWASHGVPYSGCPDPRSPARGESREMCSWGWSWSIQTGCFDMLSPHTPE